MKLSYDGSLKKSLVKDYYMTLACNSEGLQRISDNAVTKLHLLMYAEKISEH